jgi:putative spermidine/putrescine transport system substrate-binding protein
VRNALHYIATSLCIVGLAAGVAACGDDDDDATSGDGRFAGQSLVIQSAGGELAEAEEKAFYRPFEEATGADIRVVSATQAQVPALLKSQVQAGDVTFDLTSGSDQVGVERLAQEGLLAKIDYSKVPGAKQLSKGTYTEYGLVDEVDAIVPTFSTRGGVKPLTNAKDFFDVENFPGDRLAFRDDSTVECAIALVADGVAPEDLVPMDVDRCLRVWDRVKSSMTWAPAGAEMAQALIDDQVDYCLCYDGRVKQAQKTNPDWDYVYAGGEVVGSSFSIVKGTQKLDLAHAFLDFTTDAKRQAVFTEAIGYSGPNPDLAKYLPESEREKLSTAPENYSQMFKLTPEQNRELGRQRPEIEQRWSAWVAGS